MPGRASSAAGPGCAEHMDAPPEAAGVALSTLKGTISEAYADIIHITGS